MGTPRNNSSRQAFARIANIEVSSTLLTELARPRPFNFDPRKKAFRLRGAEELETFFSGSERSSRIRHVRCNSIVSRNDTRINFHNATTKPVRILWLDYAGDEVMYDCIKPNENLRCVGVPSDALPLERPRAFGPRMGIYAAKFFPLITHT